MYLKAGLVPEDKIICTNTKIGIGYQRKWVLQNTKENNWIMMLDDNIQKFTCVDKSYYQNDFIDTRTKNGINYHYIYNKEILFIDLLEKIEEMKKIADEKNIYLIGVAPYSNPFFRQKKYCFFRFVIGKIMIIKKQKKLNFNGEYSIMEDYFFTAENLLHNGKILINNFIHYKHKKFQEGGCGTYLEREKKKIELSSILVEKYKGLFRFQKKAGQHEKADVVIRLYKQKQIDKWRKEHAYI